ncbi:MAG: hypothetical protein M1531_09195 [Chloroflexi bacterium]|nr:hypothetical protein [Chloroflexota bacterium]
MGGKTGGKTEQPPRPDWWERQGPNQQSGESISPHNRPSGRTPEEPREPTPDRSDDTNPSTDPPAADVYEFDYQSTPWKAPPPKPQKPQPQRTFTLDTSWNIRRRWMKCKNPRCKSCPHGPYLFAWKWQRQPDGSRRKVERYLGREDGPKSRPPIDGQGEPIL